MPGGSPGALGVGALPALFRDFTPSKAFDMTKSLLDIAIGELGRALCCCDGLQVDLALIPEDELAQGVWDSWQQCLRTAAAAGHPPPVAAQHQASECC